MTDEEDEANRVANEMIENCAHRPDKMPGGPVFCLKCGAKFAVLLLPRKLQPLPMDMGDEE